MYSLKNKYLFRKSIDLVHKAAITKPIKGGKKYTVEGKIDEGPEITSI